MVLTASIVLVPEKQLAVEVVEDRDILHLRSFQFFLAMRKRHSFSNSSAVETFES
jgi:hypothetical protein